jgi:glutaredoxin
MREEGRVRVRLLTLNECDYCSWLKSELDGEGIVYQNIDAEQFLSFAEEVEEKFKTTSYPIVFITSQDYTLTIVPETNLETSETLRTFDSIPELIGIIKNYLK